MKAIIETPQVESSVSSEGLLRIFRKGVESFYILIYSLWRECQGLADAGSLVKLKSVKQANYVLFFSRKGKGMILLAIPGVFFNIYNMLPIRLCWRPPVKSVLQTLPATEENARLLRSSGYDAKRKK